MRKSELAIAVIVVLSLLIGAYVYPTMPARIASHWNAYGQVNGYAPKLSSLFLFPAILFALLLLFVLIPRIDPLKANIAKFRKYYDLLIVVISLFFFYVYLLTISWNLGFGFNLAQALAPAFAVLLYSTGVVIENSKRNWFIGIRTPWTLSSDRVWNKTHKLGGRLFKICGVISLLGVLLPAYALLIIIVPILLVAVYTVLYSYLEYQKGK